MTDNLRILFMGDSITALNTTERGWVGYFNEIIKPSHFENVAVSAACWEDKNGTVYDGNPFFDLNDRMTNNVVGNQVEKVLRAKDSGNEGYSNFDLIMIAAGTNWGDYITTDYINEIDTYFLKEDGSILPLEEVDRHSWAGVMRYVYEKLREAYPDAIICYCSPIQGFEAKRPYKSIRSKSIVMEEIVKRISDVHFINTFMCGICGIYEKNGENGRDLIDGLHPNINGAKKIARYNANAIKKLFL